MNLSSSTATTSTKRAPVGVGVGVGVSDDSVGVAEELNEEDDDDGDGAGDVAALVEATSADWPPQLATSTTPGSAKIHPVKVRRRMKVTVRDSVPVDPPIDSSGGNHDVTATESLRRAVPRGPGREVSP